MTTKLLKWCMAFFFCYAGYSFAQTTVPVQIIHNSPDPAASQVDIYLVFSGKLTKLDNVAFRSATAFVDLPTNTPIDIQIAPATSNSRIESFFSVHGVNLAPGNRYAVIASGVIDPTRFQANPNGKDNKFNLLVVSDVRAAASSAGNVDLRVIHGSPDAPTVGVNANGATVIPGFSYTDVTDYLSVPAASYVLEITPGFTPATRIAAFLGDVRGLAGGSAFILASGFLDPSKNQNGPGFGLIAVLANGTVINLPLIQTARAQVIHNAADPAAKLVDIYVSTLGNVVKLDDVAFRTATPFIDLPAGFPIKVAFAGPQSQSIADSIATFNLTLAANESYYVVANGVLNPSQFAANPDARSTAFNLLIATGAREKANDASLVDVRVLHGATDAPAVGVNANGATIIPGFSYTDFTGYLSVPAAAYKLDITPANTPGTSIVAFDADLTGLQGGAALVIASGFLAPAQNQNGEGFGLIAVLPDGTVIALPVSAPPTARVQVIHNAADPGAAVVDVYVDIGTDTLKINDFAFRSASPFLDLPAGKDIQIVIAGPQSTSIADGIAKFTANLAENESYYIVANGVLNPSEFAANPDGKSTAFTLFIATGAREQALDSTKIDLRVLHGASDAPTVGVNANGGTIIPAFAYEHFTDYLSVDPALYRLDVTPGNTPATVLASFVADIKALQGGAALVVASGFLDPTKNKDGKGFGLIAVLPDGTVVELPAVQSARAQVIHNAADPAAATVDIYVDVLNGIVKLDDVAFRTATPFLSLPTGYPIKIVVTGPQSNSIADGIASFEATLSANESYYVVANGVLNPANFAANPSGVNTAFNLLIATGAREKANDTSLVDLRVLHGATDAPAVGVNANGGTIIPGFSYKDFTNYLSVPSAIYRLDITPANQAANILASFTADISGLKGGAALVAASGFLTPASNQNGRPFGLIAVLPNGTVIELPAFTGARAQVVHNSADPAAALVDVYVNTGSAVVKLDNFAFRTATPFIDLPSATPIQIVVAPSSSSSINEGIATFTATLNAGATYHIVANGVLNPTNFAANPDGVSTAFNLLIKEGGKESAFTSDAAIFRVLHGASDAPKVGINVNGATLLNELGYTAFSDNFSVPSQEYKIDVTPAGQPTNILATYYANLDALNSSASLVIASGFLNPAQNQSGAAFGVFAVQTDGVVVPLPATPTATRNALDNANNALLVYPNPANGSAQIQYNLDHSASLSIQLMDLSGKTLYRNTTDKLIAGTHTFTLPVSNVKPGMYLISVSSDTTRATQRIVVK